MEMDIGVKSKGAVALGSVHIPDKYFHRFGTGIPSIDNMFGEGGFIKGQVISLTAARGCGKTTAMLQILNGVMEFDSTKKCLYLSGEEYVEQLAFAARRINTPLVLADNETDIDEISKLTKKYDIIVIDSLNSITHKEYKNNNRQIHAVNTLYKSAKENDCVIIFIQHMTKDGKNGVGVTAIEHCVDTCIKILNVNAEDYGELNCKAFCVDKNRFGQTKDSIFKMTNKGWDFSNPIREDLDNKTSGTKTDPRKIRKLEEFKKIFSLFEKKSYFRIDDIKSIVKEIEDFDRFERRVKELVNMGVLKKVGRGRYSTFHKTDKTLEIV